MKGCDFLKENNEKIMDSQPIQNDNAFKVITVIIDFLQLCMPVTIAKRLVSMILMSVGVSDSEIAELTGLCDKSVHNLRRSMQEESVEDLLKIKKGSGRKSFIDGIREEIIEEIKKNDCRTKQQIVDMIKEKFDIHVSVYTVGRFLKKTEIKD